MTLTFTDLQDIPCQRIRLARINGRWVACFSGDFGEDAFTLQLPFGKQVEPGVIVAYLQRLNPDSPVVADPQVMA